MDSTIKQYKISKIATQLFIDKGYDNVIMLDIAKKAAIDEAELYSFFGNKQDIVLFLYQSINSDWQQQVNDLPKGKLAERFHKAMLLKIDLMADYEVFLGNITGQLMQDPTIAVNTSQTSHIRAMGIKTIQSIILGSTDSKMLAKKIKNLPALFYLMHWMVLFLHLQTRDKKRTIEVLDIISKAIVKVNGLSLILNLVPFINDLGAWATKFTNQLPINKSNTEILKIIFNHRKLNEGELACKQNKCETCFELHDLDINYFTSQNLPIHFILPAFPAKSPNTNKTLGKLPDLGEEMALITLNNLCREIKSVYPPGATITICSDGRIFSELVGVSDEDITIYVKEIRKMINDQNLSYLTIINLEDLMEGNSFHELREHILAAYSETLEELHLKLQSNDEFKKLFNGIHRFISDDQKYLNPQYSTTRIKEDSKVIALKVIQNSNAWTRFLTYVYPKSIRLSIHPYPAHASKIGIQLTRAANNWITPWHGVVILQEDGYLLMKKSEAIERNATLVFRENRPYYYTLIKK